MECRSAFRPAQGPSPRKKGTAANHTRPPERDGSSKQVEGFQYPARSVCVSQAAETGGIEVVVAKLGWHS